MTVWLSFLTAFLLSLALTPIVRRLARRRGVVARPRLDRWHRGEVPLLGGVAIFLASQLTALGAGAFRGETAAILGLGSVVFVGGLVDDLRPLRPATKLVLQIVAALAVAFLRPGSSLTGNPGLDVILSVIWVVAITNAVNLLDNMDGLAAGVSVIAVVFYIAVAGHATTATLALAALGGALAGFLVFNFNPASIFMGDCGSLFVGFVVAASALPVVRANAGSFLTAVVPPAVLLAIPILDTALVASVRLLSGRAVSVGGRDHTSHRLVAIGLSERSSVLVLYGLSATAGAVAVLVRHSSPSEGAIFVTLLVVVLILFAVHLARVRVYEDGHFAKLEGGRFTPLLVELAYKRRVFDVLLDLVLSWLSYSAAFRMRFEGAAAAEFQEAFLRAMPIVIVCKMCGLWLAGIYRGVWRHVSLPDLLAYVKGVVFGSGLAALAVLFLYRFQGYSRGAFVIDALVFLVLIVGSRLSFRLLLESARYRRADGIPVLVYGAGSGGDLVVRELTSNASYDWTPVGFIDDDSLKRGRRILGVPVLGSLDDLEAALDRTSAVQVIVSTATIAGERAARLEAICRSRQVQVLRMRLTIE